MEITVTIATGQRIKIDTSNEKCLAFGFKNGERVNSILGSGTVLGVALDPNIEGSVERLWLKLDDRERASYFSDLSMISHQA